MQVALGLDASQVSSGIAQAMSAFTNFDDTIVSSTAKMVAWNVEAEKVKATFTAQTADFHKLERTYTMYPQGLTQKINGVDVMTKQPGTIDLTSSKITEDNAAKNKAARAAMKAQAAIDKAQLEAEMNSFGAKIEDIKNKFLNIGAIQLFKIAVRDLISSFVEGAKSAIEFELEITKIQAISSNAGVTTNQWAQAFENLSNKFGIDQLDIAKAAYQAITMQIAKGAETVPFLTQALELSIVTGTKAEQSVNLLGNTLNSFQQKAGQAGHTAAILFQTMSQTGLSGAQLEGQFGRLGEIGHILGISLEETAGSLITLKNSGLQANQAVTYLSTMMQKLLNPSEEMKRVFESWGTPTAEAAIATFGWVGVLNKLEVAANGSTTELAKLFGEMRGGRAATGLSIFGNLNKSIEDLKINSDKAYAIAKKISEDSPARTIQKEFTTIKNFFIDDFGRTVLQVVSDFSNRYISLSTVVTTGTNAVLSAVKGWVAYKVVVTAVSVVTTAYNAVMGTATITQVGFMGMVTRTQVGLTGLIASYSSVIAKVSAYAAALALAYYWNEQTNKSRAVQGGELINRLQDEKSRQSINAPGDAAQREADDTKKNIDAIYASTIAGLARSYQIASTNLESLRTKAKQLGEELKVAFDTGVNRFKNEISELNKNISELLSLMKTNEKFNDDFGEKIKETFENEKMKYANTAQQIDLLRQKLETLKNEIAKNAEVSGDATKSVEEKRDADERLRKEADQLIPTYIKLRDTYKQLIEEQARYSAAQNYKYNGVTDPTFINATQFVNQTGEGLKELYEFVNAAISKSNQGLKETVKTQQELVLTKKAELEAIEISAKNYFELQKKFETGEIQKDPRFQTAGQYDPTKSKAAYDAALKELVGKTGERYSIFIEFFKKLDAAETSIVKIGEAERYQIRLKSLMDIAIQQKKILEDAAQSYADTIKSSTTGIFEPDTGSLGKLSQVMDKYKQIFNLPNVIELGDQNLKRFSEQGSQDLQKVLDLIQKLRDVKLDQPGGINEAKTILNQIGVASAKVEADVTGMIDVLKQKNVDMSKIAISAPDSPRGVVTVQDVLDERKKQLKATQDLADEAERAKQNLDILNMGTKESAEKAAEGIKKATTALLTSGGDAETSLVGNFGNVNNEIKKNITSVENLAQQIQDKLQNIGAINIPINFTTNEGPTLDLPPIDNQYFAAGGRVGGPRGSDNIPAWLTKGEFVVNKDATRQFYSQLVAMNASVRPGYYSQGGYVTTNVGDIHVSVTGTGSPERDVRAFAAQVRREVKRGTIKLS